MAVCQLTQDFSSRLSENSDNWRWVIIGTAMAFQSGCVLALLSTDTSETTVQKEAEEHYAYLAGDLEKRPKSFMAPPWQLIERLEVLSLIEHLSDENRNDLERLFALRNEFVHFLPKAWAMETSGLPRIIDAAWMGLERLPRGIHISEGQNIVVESSIEKIRRIMSDLGIQK